MVLNDLSKAQRLNANFKALYSLYKNVDDIMENGPETVMEKSLKTLSENLNAQQKEEKEETKWRHGTTRGLRLSFCTIGV